MHTDILGQPIIPSSGVKNFTLDSWPLKTGPISFPETSVRHYHYSLHNNPEECSSQTSHLLEKQCFRTVGCQQCVTLYNKFSFIKNMFPDHCSSVEVLNVTNNV